MRRMDEKKKANEAQGKEVLEHYTGQSLVWMRHFLFYISESVPQEFQPFLFEIVAAKSNCL